MQPFSFSTTSTINEGIGNKEDGNGRSKFKSVTATAFDPKSPSTLIYFSSSPPSDQSSTDNGGGGGGGGGHQGKRQGQEQSQWRGGDDRGDGPPRPGKNNVKENSRAIGHYFFFCAKPKSDSTKCRFARPVEDELKPKKERLCAFLSRKGFCKKGDACKFSHDLSLKDDICPRATDAEKDGEEGQSDVDHDSGDDADQNTKDNSEICQAAKEEEIEKNSPADGDDGSSSSSSTSGTSSSSSSSGDSDSDSSDSDSD
mmetsp:Transcript_8648/g.12346  ORF Transcript_8648/g.12346 Transcript_8648/m.12346 type:complete len:256 (+) Transcript_8648:71-838(+)